MKNFAINYNSNKDINEEIIEKIKISLFNNFPDCSIFLFKDSVGLKDEFSKNFDILIVLGGDGTILRAAGAISSYNVPILGINTGNLGYLSSIELKDLEYAVAKIKNGEFDIENRFMLECRLQGEDEKLNSLNDVVVLKGIVPGVAFYKIYIDDKFYTNIEGDGIIISTPTGSTAYNISAGGPIIYPNLQVIAVTPICSHYVGIRPMVIDGNSKIRIMIKERNEKVYLVIDGNIIKEVEYDGEILIEKSDYTCKLIKFENYNYFSILKNKILGTRNIEGEIYENRKA
ncbi:MAG: NAD(+)/NADH kinase [Clostridiaceae bacterium]